jgi:hypothetical protein
MDSYIEGQRQKGELDSQGAFTVDSLGALRKTLASALPEPHYYLFQIVQGLVAGGALKIEVAIGRHATRFHFSDPLGTFKDLEAAKARLFQGLTLSSPRPLDLLLTGMATAVGSEMDRADLHVGYGSQSLQISLDDASLVERPDGHRNPLSYLELHRSVSKGLSFAWTRIWGARGEEGDLQRRFEFVTPPLKVAGLSTSPGSAWRREVAPTKTLGRLILLEVAVLDPDRPNHRGPGLPVGSLTEGSVGCLCRWAYDAQGGRLALAQSAPEWEQRAWSFYGTASAQVESTVWWIRNGMTVEKSLLDLGLPGLLVLAPAEGLDLDASGYAIVRNDKFRARVQQAVEMAAKTLGAVSRSDLFAALSGPNAPALVSARNGEAPPTVDALLDEYPWLA